MRTIEDFARKYSGMSEDKFHNRSLTYTPNDMYDAIVSTFEFAQRWIPVEEELPEITDRCELDDNKLRYSKYVFVKVKGYEYPLPAFYVKFDDDEFFEFMGLDGILQNDITHWRYVELK